MERAAYSDSFTISEFRKCEVIPTQIYFPGEAHNATDPLFNPALVMRVQETTAGPLASFDFLLETEK